MLSDFFKKEDLKQAVFRIAVLVLLSAGIAIAATSDFDSDLDIDGQDLAELSLQVDSGTAGDPEILSFASQFGQIMPGEIVASLTVREKNGTALSNTPVTFGHVFSEGEVPDTVAVQINGTELSTQCDVKRRWDDGSLRHAVISVVIPAITANGDVVLDLVRASGLDNGTPMSKSDILATGIQSIMELSEIEGSGYSGSLTANLRDAINSQTELNYWLQGSVCTEIIVNQRLNNSLNALWTVRFYPGTSYGWRISNTIENVEAEYRGNVSYALNINYGYPEPANVYHKDKFQHHFNARWRKVLWHGQEPSEIEIRYDLDYLIATGHIPKYDTGLVIPESTVNSHYTRWSGADNDIMGISTIAPYFPMTGNRDEIGILPNWTACYLLSMDNRMRDMMLNIGELSGSIPIHMRESDPTRSFFGHIVSIDDRPSVWLDRTSFRYTAEEDRLPEPIGETDTPWSVDRAHQTSFAYVPYLITGDYYFLQEMYYWSGWDLGACTFNPDYGRDYSKGLLRDQVRGEAWALRVIAQAAALAPDNDIEKPYLKEKIMNNIVAWLSETVDNPDSHPLHAWGHTSCRSHDGGRPNETIVGCTAEPTGTGSGVYEDTLPVRHATLPWHGDFMILSLHHTLKLGYPTQELLDWLGHYTINRFTHPEVNPYNGANYRLPSTYTLDANINDPYYYIDTWLQFSESVIDQPTAFESDSPAPFSYIYNARAALACLSHLEEGYDAYLWIDSQVANQDSLNENPTWALAPDR